jgi:hypothetical protein
MIEHLDNLDDAIEWILSKGSNNIIHHEWGATMTQDEHDAHADALGHHASAIHHYRNKPEVKKALEQIGELVKHRSYVKKPIKLTNKTAPTISVEDLDMNHPSMKSRTDHETIVKALNNHIAAAHKAFHGSADLQKLHSHSDRFLAHLSSMVGFHNLQQAGKLPHAQVAGAVHAPELTDRSARIGDSKYRKSFHAGNGKYTTQSITKGTAAGWDPGLPEITSLEEEHGHSSAGQHKELYPFHEVKVNNKPIEIKAFKEKEEPDEIHDRDAHVNLPRHRMVRGADGKVDRAIGTHQGNPSAMRVVEHMERLGTLKKTEQQASAYFTAATVAHVVLAKNLIQVLNPYAGMTDEEFGDYVRDCQSRTLGPSEQAAIIAETSNRFEKAQAIEEMHQASPEGGVIEGAGDAPSTDLSKARNAAEDRRKGDMFVNSRKIPDREHAKGVAEVLAGTVHPLPLPDETDHELLGDKTPKARTKKDGEKRDEAEDMTSQLGMVKRSPYAVPKHVFTDDSYSKIDPDKYKEWVHGEMTENDVRQQIAAYQGAIRHNPKAQQAHQKFVDLHRQNVQEGLGRAADPESQTPRVDHGKEAQKLGEARQSGMTAREMAQRLSESGSKASKASTRKAGEDELTPDEQKIREADPDYKPQRLGSGRKSAASSEKDLTDIAQGKMPAHMLADSNDFGELDSQYGDAQMQEMVGGKGDDGEGVVQGTKTSAPSPVQLINEHPGFKAYLTMKDHMLSHYKTPAVREYMERKLLEHENNPNLDVGKLAAMHHFLHRSRKQAEKASGGLDKLAGDLASVPQGDEGADEPAGTGKATAPETMMTPEQRQRYDQVKQEKGQTLDRPPTSKEIGDEKLAPQAAVDPNRGKGVTTNDPEYKKKLMAEMQAREDSKRAAAKAPKPG